MHLDDDHLCVYVLVCLSLALFPHILHNPTVTLRNGSGVPPSCAMLGGFAVGARVWLLWQHTHLMRNVSEDACSRCMAGPLRPTRPLTFPSPFLLSFRYLSINFRLCSMHYAIKSYRATL